ncbi:Sulfate transp domain containing protein [Asbolus verrucosus]|uniref:Sulfate transp domain containing protein n=1 Tax=Asbolus verrucosus TaxID=1661398 RepID=A0A482VBZ3_ASBVE|nr:Sulfate transp domain containing protein [Asbolus verrucosus]
MEISCVVVESPDEKTEISEEKSPQKCIFDWKKTLRRKVPIITWIHEYNIKSFLHDLLAGFTVALTEIPQSMAYASIAGLPLQYGLYSSFMGGFVYAIFGSCRAINMGSTSLMALLIQSHVAEIGIGASTFMSFIGGIIILLLGLVNLGFVIEFFSYPVMAGFTSAAALTIASSQIKNFLGIEGQANEFLESWESMSKKIGETNKWDALLGTISLIILFFLKEISVFGNTGTSRDSSKISILAKRSIFFLSVAKNAIIVIMGMATAYILEQKGLNCLHLTGHVEGGFPQFEVPPPFNDSFQNFVETIKEFGVSLVFIPLVAILETIAVAKVFSRGKTLDASQEMIALGIANLLGSFADSMPVTGSFTRTAVNNASGAKTNIAAVFTGLTILMALKFLTSTFYYIPKATLAAVIMCAMFYLFDFDAFAVFWKNNRLDLIPFLVTLLSSLFISLEYGILIGIATNLTFVLYSTARPRLNLEVLKLPGHQNEIFLIKPSSTIFFPAADHLRNAILKSKEDALIVFNGECIHSMDITVAKVRLVVKKHTNGTKSDRFLQSISDLATKLETKNQRILFLNFKPSIRAICTGINKKLADKFKIGELEDIIQGE